MHDVAREEAQGVRSGMAVHLEFVVPGPPISNQQNQERGRHNLETWREVIRDAAARKWRKPLFTGHLKASIINFYEGTMPSVDVDNMSKPILDSLQGIVSSALSTLN
jgi:hypothetical protein